MTQSGKKALIFADLSARLPYHPKIKVWYKILNGDIFTEIGNLDIVTNLENILRDFLLDDEITQIKPYLIPISELPKYLTAEQRYELAMVQGYKLIDWFNAHHVDYRGLIALGLALKASKKTYKLI